MLARPLVFGLVLLAAAHGTAQEAVQQPLIVRNVPSAHRLNLREWANPKTATLLEIPHNAAGLMPTGRTHQDGSDGWIEVIYQGKKGWVNSKYVGPERAEPPAASTDSPFSSGDLLRIADAAEDDKLNMRAEPSARSAIVHELPAHASGIVASGDSRRNGDVVWIKVKYGSKVGWVNSRYVRAIGGSDKITTTATSADAQGGGATPANPKPLDQVGAGTKLRVQGPAKGDKLNLRTDASAASDVLDELAADATGIVATGRAKRTAGETWIEVHFKDHVGWVNSRYVREAQETASAKGEDERKVETGAPLRERPASAEPPLPSSDAALADCDSDDDLRKLSGCSALIERGALPDASIAIARSRRADAFLVAGDYDNAVIDLVAALGIRLGDEALSKRLAHAYDLRGADRRRQGNAAGAVADYTEAIRLDPTNPAALAARAGLNVLKNDYGAAIADLEAASRLDNANPTYRSALARLHEERGVASLSKGDVEQAIDSFSAAIKLEPDREVLYIHRAAAREAKKDLSGALADYSEAKRLNPSNVIAYLQSGALSLALGDSSGAIGHLDEAIRRNPSNVAAYMMRGLAFEEARRPDRSTADYQTVLKLEPSNKLAKASLDRVRPRPAKPPVDETGAASLRACCIAYCRIVECNSPPLPRACSASMIARYYLPMGVAAAKKNYLAGAKAVLRRRVSIPECQ
ncbi:SH3 domain-containing protein [Hyphomicrobium sp.]|uniref:tetratricopeptide repeat protein n=1 Tax=Hyphomicrobium sp. TaxID=82 RepID=UPI0025C4C9F3|nr:SH3 domain-containing protein [Hyphomicrobium sp.]